MNNISCYIHIPFCQSKCPYCDFYSLRCDTSQQTANNSSLRCNTSQQTTNSSLPCPPNQQATKAKDLIAAYTARCTSLLTQADYRWKTAYLGGGTPSILPPARLAELLAAIRPNLIPNAEVTIECNPSSVTPAFCRICAQGGVNRISMGLQSIVPTERQALGRAGGHDQITNALNQIRAAGIQNISLDVMLGIPHQTAASLEETLTFCAAANATHISAYLLKIEPNTPFAISPPANLPNEDAQADLYLHCCEWLEAQGYRQYEISNFSKPGFESQHNLTYWHCEEYYAVGPSAHGYTNGRRWHYPRSLEKFLQGASPKDDGPGGSQDERAMLALRLIEGLPNPTEKMLQKAAPYAANGCLTATNQAIRLTPKGFLLSNTILADLL